jgi:NAD(P)-dependent dehydrogenase (short-subunit alcohol dehydrogenase family)
LELAGKVAIVTGGNSGIGRAICELFAAEGARVVIADVNAYETLDPMTNRGGETMFIKTDIRDEDQVRNLVAQTVDAFQGVDILCNNAGIFLMKPLTETTGDEWDDVIDTNLKGAFLVSKHVIPHMVEKGGGTIVNTASQLGLVGLDRYTAYCASKGGMILLTKAMALEYARHGIRVNCVCPGAIDTPMVEKELSLEADPAVARKAWIAKHPLGRLGRAEEIAQAVLFLASERSSFATGEALVIDGGYTTQ